MAIAAFVVGMLSIFVPVLGGIIAIVLGIVALIMISRSRDTKSGYVMAVIGILLGALTGGGWALLIGNEDFQAGFMEGLEEAVQETSTSSNIAVGDCLDMSLTETRNFFVSSDDVVPCSTPHTAEFAGSKVLPESPEYPGEEEVQYQAVGACLDVFLAYTGVELATRDDLDLFFEYPRSVNWRLNDREVSCFIVNMDSGTRIGSVRD